MDRTVLRYAITDRRLFPGSLQAQLAALVTQAANLARDGVDYLQLREKDLPPAQRMQLAAAMLRAVEDAGSSTRLLWNGTAAEARAAGVHGMHLDGAALSHATAADFRPPQPTPQSTPWIDAPCISAPCISASCHTLAEVEHARTFVTLILFAPVFEKRVAGEAVQPGVGLQRLQQACAAAGDVPVLALGGVTAATLEPCLAAGAAGYAAIRAFL